MYLKVYIYVCSGAVLRRAGYINIVTNKGTMEKTCFNSYEDYIVAPDGYVVFPSRNAQSSIEH